WGDDGQGGTPEKFQQPLPCNCGALENFEHGVAETYKEQLSQAQQALRASNRMLAWVADHYRAAGYCELQEIEVRIKANEAALPSDAPCGKPAGSLHPRL